MTVQRKPVLVCLMLFLIAGFVFLPALSNGFVHFDDDIYIFENLHVQKGFTWAGLHWAFRTVVGGFWHPLTWLSIMLDRQLFGLHAAGHHLTSLLLHGVNTVLVFLVLHKMTDALWRSAFAAALFALHPLHVESVVWAAERKDVLSAFFFLLTLTAYSEYATSAGRQGAQGNGPRMARNEPPTSKIEPPTSNEGTGSEATGSKFDVRYSRFKLRLFWYTSSLLFFICGLMSKTMVVTVPLILLLLDFWPLRRFEPSVLKSGRPDFRRLLLEKAPFVAAALACACITVLAQHKTGALRSVERFPIFDRLANAAFSCVNYLAQTAWPRGLAVYYPYPRAFPMWRVAGAVASLLVTTVLVLRAAQSRPYLALGWFWYLIMLAPVIGLIQVGGQAHADRYTYLPLVGVFVMVAWGANDLTKRLPGRAAFLGSGAAAVLIPCFVLGRVQIGYWNDSERLFRHALAVTKDNDLAHNNLGVTLAAKRQFEEAVTHLLEAIRLAPREASPRLSLAEVLVAEGRTNDARAQFEAALALLPTDSVAHEHFGKFLAKFGHQEEATAHFREALRLNPGSAHAHCTLGIALVNQERLDEAIGQFREALRLEPDYVAARNNLGATLGRKGQLDEAISQMEEVVKLVPAEAAPHCNLGDALAAKGLLDEAILEYQEALRLAPRDPGAHGHFGDVLLRKKRFEEAIAQYQEALQLKPDYTDARDHLKAAEARLHGP